MCARARMPAACVCLTNRVNFSFLCVHGNLNKLISHRVSPLCLSSMQERTCTWVARTSFSPQHLYNLQDTKQHVVKVVSSNDVQGKCLWAVARLCACMRAYVRACATRLLSYGSRAH